MDPPNKRLAMQSFDVFFADSLNNLLDTLPYNDFQFPVVHWEYLEKINYVIT